MRQTFAALLLGAATVLGFAPFGLFPLPLVTLALLFALWREAAAPARAAWLGFTWGLGFFLAGVSWVYVSMHDVGGMAAPLAAVATLLFCAVLALFPALAGFAFSRWKCGAPWRDAGFAAGAWMSGEWLRGWAFTGFPWLALGYSQAPPSPLAGFAPVLGSYGVGLIAAFLAAALVFNRCRGWVAVVGVALLGLGLRDVAWTAPVGEPLTVNLLQGNIPQAVKWVPERLPLSVETYTRLAARHKADITVLPETAIPLFFDNISRDTLRALTRTGAALIGVAVRTKTGGYANGAVALTTHGRLSSPTDDEATGPSAMCCSTLSPDFKVQAYAKTHLVPFGEYIPPGFDWFFALVNIPMTDFAAGAPGQKPLSIAGQRVMPNICYEDLFGEEIVRALPESTLLVNLSNTAWFGDSLAQPQHLQIAQMRALETGRPMLRATNTGMTAAVAPDGTVTARLAPFTSDVLTVQVRGFDGMTPYARWGNGLALLLAICACLPALLQAYRNRRSR